MSVFVPPTLNVDQDEGRLSRMLRRPTKRKHSAVRIVSTVSADQVENDIYKIRLIAYHLKCCHLKRYKKAIYESVASVICACDSICDNHF
ncbi:unnamed protein product [Acanthocheilonema viteae]|uniref:Uncharacterized protein n=1 Tax=Acanthocheilonema viteae TaxID=6277 RepID=A0A498SCV6_ACAVI|nr:unnamed protein product [Acanthocheilonema viteae]